MGGTGSKDKGCNSKSGKAQGGKEKGKGGKGTKAGTASTVLPPHASRPIQQAVPVGIQTPGMLLSGAQRPAASKLSLGLGLIQATGALPKAGAEGAALSKAKSLGALPKN